MIDLSTAAVERCTIASCRSCRSTPPKMVRRLLNTHPISVQGNTSAIRHATTGAPSAARQARGRSRPHGWSGGADVSAWALRTARGADLGRLGRLVRRTAAAAAAAAALRLVGRSVHRAVRGCRRGARYRCPASAQFFGEPPLDFSFMPVCPQPTQSPYEIDLLHPLPSVEANKHKLKRLVQTPNSFFMDVKCPGCFNM